MYIMYINASSTTTSYTHVSLYMVWRIHPPPPLTRILYHIDTRTTLPWHEDSPFKAYRPRQYKNIIIQKTILFIL